MDCVFVCRPMDASYITNVVSVNFHRLSQTSHLHNELPPKGTADFIQCDSNSKFAAKRSYSISLLTEGRLHNWMFLTQFPVQYPIYYIRIELKILITRHKFDYKFNIFTIQDNFGNYNTVYKNEESGLTLTPFILSTVTNHDNPYRTRIIS